MLFRNVILGQLDHFPFNRTFRVFSQFHEEVELLSLFLRDVRFGQSGSFVDFFLSLLLFLLGIGIGGDTLEDAFQLKKSRFRRLFLFIGGQLGFCFRIGCQLLLQLTFGPLVLELPEPRNEVFAILNGLQLQTVMI